MKRFLVLSVVLLSACNSATSPVTTLSGRWVVRFDSDTAGALTNIWQGGLTQSGSSITGAGLCGAGTLVEYDVTGQVTQQLTTMAINLAFVGGGNDTAHVTGTVRDSANYGVIASGTFGDNATGQCLSGSGHWFARQFTGP